MGGGGGHAVCVEQTLQHCTINCILTNCMHVIIHTTWCGCEWVVVVAEVGGGCTQTHTPAARLLQRGLTLPKGLAVVK